MKHPEPWTPEEDAILRAAYEDDAVDYPLAAAFAKLPTRTIAATCTRANSLGFPQQRRRRREAAGLPPLRGPKKASKQPTIPRIAKPSKYASLPIAPLPIPKSTEPPWSPSTTVHALRAAPEPPKAAPLPVAPKPCTQRPPTPPLHTHSACDRGDREFIRRRLVAATIPTLARELQRSPDAIAAAMRELAAEGFRAPKLIGLTAEEIAGMALGEDHGRPEVRARRATAQ